MTCIAMFVKNLSTINGLSIFSHWFFLPILAPVLNLIDLLLLCYAQSCLTFFDPINCCPPGSSVHGISCARILEWVAISYSRRTFLTQWSNLHLLCFLHWQVDSLPFCHWEALNWLFWHYTKLWNQVVLHFQNCSSYSRSFVFLYKFWDQLVNFYTKPCCDFDRVWIGTVHQFGENCHPDNTKSFKSLTVDSVCIIKIFIVLSL